jgi:hypothetical protein
VENRRLAPPNQQLRAAVRWFYAWIGATVLLGVGPIAALRLIEFDTLPARLAGVIVGAGSLVPWLWVVAAMIRRGDEFVRRIHLTAIAWAFAGAMFLVLALHWLVVAGFIAPPDLLLVWFALLVLWFAAIVIVKRRFERAP